MIQMPRLEDPTATLREATGDDRLHAPDAPCSCFMCGRKILQRHDSCHISSPVTGGIRLAAHSTCTEDPVTTGLRYQQACSAISRGAKEPVFSPLGGVAAKGLT